VLKYTVQWVGLHVWKLLDETNHTVPDCSVATHCRIHCFLLIISLAIIFTARQYAMHAERDIVLPILSACPYVQCRYCIKMNGRIVTLFPLSNKDMILLFKAQQQLQNSKGNPSAGHLNIRGWWKILYIYNALYLGNGTR